MGWYAPVDTDVMITGSLKQNVDLLWTTFLTGGISNPLSVIEQITYLLFMRLLDEAQARARRTRKDQKGPHPSSLRPRAAAPPLVGVKHHPGGERYRGASKGGKRTGSGDVDDIDGVIDDQ